MTSRDEWRLIDGIERDFEHALAPWLQKKSTMPGDPADRLKSYIIRLIELVREAEGK